jgi:hypothetical protein
MNTKLSEDIPAEIKDINELIINPKEFIKNLKNVKILNNNLLIQYDNMMNNSIKNINKQIYLDVCDSIKSYADVERIQQDLKTHKLKNSYNLDFKKYDKKFKKSIMDNSTFEDNLFDDLYLSDTDQKYFKTMNKINNQLQMRNNFIMENINNVSSQYVSDYKGKVINYIKSELLPKLYKFHLSYLKAKQEKIEDDIIVNLGDKTKEVINTKQQEFLNHMIKKYLKI